MNKAYKLSRTYPDLNEYKLFNIYMKYINGQRLKF
jgi:hypothetical protein